MNYINCIQIATLPLEISDNELITFPNDIRDLLILAPIKTYSNNNFKN